MLKRCVKCEEHKPLSEFNKSKGQADGLYSYCRDCGKIVARKWREDNAARQKARTAAWYEANRERHAVLTRAWRADHMQDVLEKNRKRRAIQAGATVDAFSYRDIAAHFASLGLDSCVYCNGPFEHIDHVVPLARGGTHALINLVPSCARCNLRKGTSTAEEYITRVASEMAQSHAPA